MTAAVTNRSKTMGRPPGSSRLNPEDRRLCRQAADQLLANHALSTRAALLRAIPPMPENRQKATLRRLQSKFDRNVELAAAHHRAETAAEAKRALNLRVAEGVRMALSFSPGGAGFKTAVNDLLKSPFGQKVDLMMRDGTLQKLMSGMEPTISQ